jgi:hypothetical protein
MFAYRNASGYIVGLSTVARTLAQAQAVNPDIVSVDPNPSQAEVDAFNTGNQFREAKIAKAARVDARTEELINGGFDSTVAAPKRFRMDNEALTRYNAYYHARNEPWFTYPLVINTYDNDQLQNLPNAAAIETLFEETVIALRGHIDSGTVLKQQIRAATTWAELAAVEDNR